MVRVVVGVAGVVKILNEAPKPRLRRYDMYLMMTQCFADPQ